MRLSRFLAAAALGLASTLVLAAEPDQTIRKTLQSLQPDLPIETISASPVQGLYQVQLKGGRVLYASTDGNFVVQGNIYQVKDGAATNITEVAEAAGVAKTINALPASDMVVFPAQGKAKAHITVFTDTTCPYCQKLHAEVPELNKRGIEVRYLAFPRQGPKSPGDQQLQAVWCSKDRAAAMTEMFHGKEIKAAQCPNPVDKQFQLGQMVGVQGTPAIILESGQMLPGYQSAGEIAKLVLDTK
ncbi:MULTISPECIES: DsbC family protein [Pseudomonas]|jgi:thiol:disulfide interchange protein DsbC|uniref:DsbC family protein n=1 Tax=Pseudomonas TaxID=286 RepID=UPI0005BAA187|nr:MULTISPECIES: DsbC family protein [Pseudomonas]KWR80031.1 protein-disulfide isomerase [Pseudomonas sp. PI1]MCP1641739.1 thiol:disulfide interchange protein DsbC [Pseudomonas citronellolis]MCP1664657.1 thiol:disulfide interchange protein DsbC [Pseudomonas citronellolis]MCP1695884.1 thiol:disulfide interchange protein DsbC [Pseudomonas citronellolis]MCP1702493.1 thiol:disulfide interchange protein DsbC [Pseudomonas citronellolis]